LTLRMVGTTGEALAHNLIKPHVDSRLTIGWAGGSGVSRLGTRPASAYQVEAFAAQVLDGAWMPLDSGDAVENMSYVVARYRASGMAPSWICCPVVRATTAGRGIRLPSPRGCVKTKLIIDELEFAGVAGHLVWPGSVGNCHSRYTR